MTPLARLVCATALALAVLPSTAALAAPARLLLVPLHAIGEVREIHQRRVSKGLADALAGSGAVTLVRDTKPVQASERPAAAAVAVDPRIQRADELRQQGTELAMADQHAKALPLLQRAIAGYLAAWAELVDFGKLADAYARAGVSAYGAGKPAKVAARFFDDGLRLQPTLAIDRRRASKELLALFDARRAALEAGPRGAIRVEGAAEGAEVYIDGVRAGPLPAQRDGLPAGPHVVQVRGERWITFAKRVSVGRKEVVVKAKLRPVLARLAEAARVWTFDDLTPLIVGGAFVGGKGRAVVAKLAAQTAAAFLLYPVIVADRYGRLSLHAFLQRADGKVVALPEAEIDKNLSDVAAKISALVAAAGAAVERFPLERALDKPPKLLR
jgi:hypothetical protein